MQGTVQFINREDDVLAVETEQGKYTVFGLLGEYEVEIGDVVSGALEAMDQQVFSNQTRGIEMQVYVEDVSLGRDEAERKVG